MRAMDKHKLKRALVVGDGSDAALYASAAGEAGGSLLKMIAAKQAADEKAKKDKEQAAKDKAARADLDAAMADLKQKQKAAAMAHADADAASAKADAVETDPNGPLHTVAKQAQQKASIYDADVLSAQKKVDYYQGGGTGKVPSMKVGGGLPSWVKPVGIGAGVLVVGYVGYRLFFKKKRR
jgi:hypothetical protein